MTIEEMENRRAKLVNSLTIIRHSWWGSVYPFADHWIAREIARYENKIARRLAEVGW
jgi:hypothetical protein